MVRKRKVWACKAKLSSAFAADDTLDRTSWLSYCAPSLGENIMRTTLLSRAVRRGRGWRTWRTENASEIFFGAAAPLGGMRLRWTVRGRIGVLDAAANRRLARHTAFDLINNTNVTGALRDPGDCATPRRKAG
ncbi:hypothetical protein GMJLKIPL_1405 [Methylobacterium isbiliense]|jgi:hypothetical protein|uniref:Uncharacterized protein n=2 Tax=Methylobacterium isbiliense TaxID=315478 RepID=A0ABQ4SAT8_9HYPH|nr:hypothetical protein GMJLKIPL_1405 [Methylobacterium isbiliense]